MAYTTFTNTYESEDYQPCSTNEECELEYKNKCEFYQSGSWYWQLTTTYSQEYWFDMLGLISGIISLAFFLVIYRIKEL